MDIRNRTYVLTDKRNPTLLQFWKGKEKMHFFFIESIHVPLLYNIVSGASIYVHLHKSVVHVEKQGFVIFNMHVIASLSVSRKNPYIKDTELCWYAWSRQSRQRAGHWYAWSWSLLRGGNQALWRSPNHDKSIIEPFKNNSYSERPTKIRETTCDVTYPRSLHTLTSQTAEAVAAGLPFRRQISSRTVLRRLVAARIHPRRPYRGPYLTPRHLRQRIQWARRHLQWTLRRRGRVRFTDESRFLLRHVDGRARVFRRREDYVSIY